MPSNPQAQNTLSPTLSLTLSAMIACAIGCGDAGGSPTNTDGTAGGTGSAASTGRGGSSGSGGTGMAGPCTITMTGPDPTCEKNCLDSVDPVTCLALCSDVTTRTPGLLCGGQCIDTSADARNCGGCGQACAGICTGGQCKQRCTGLPPAASLVTACMNLCSQMGPTCDYSGIMGCTTFRAFVPPGGGGCGGGSPWTGQPACVSECERQVAYTGSCVDLIAAAMTCWPLVCSTGHAVFTKQAPDCATLNAAAQDCVNTCAF